MIVPPFPALLSCPLREAFTYFCPVACPMLDNEILQHLILFDRPDSVDKISQDCMLPVLQGFYEWCQSCDHRKHPYLLFAATRRRVSSGIFGYHNPLFVDLYAVYIVHCFAVLRYDKDAACCLQLFFEHPIAPLNRAS